MSTYSEGAKKLEQASAKYRRDGLIRLAKVTERAGQAARRLDKLTA